MKRKQHYFGVWVIWHTKELEGTKDMITRCATREKAEEEAKFFQRSYGTSVAEVVVIEK